MTVPEAKSHMKPLEKDVVVKGIKGRRCIKH